MCHRCKGRRGVEDSCQEILAGATARMRVPASEARRLKQVEVKSGALWMDRSSRGHPGGCVKFQ